MDNGKTFHSREVRQLLEQFDVDTFYRCAYRPEGNSIIERNHRTIKSCAARTNICPTEAVFWYNVLPKSATKDRPCQLAYNWRIPGEKKTIQKYHDNQRSKYTVGMKVFVKPMGARCTTQWKVGHITQVMSSTNVKVDGVSRHVRDVRQIRSPCIEDNNIEDETGDRKSRYSTSSSESEDEQDVICEAESRESSSDPEHTEELPILRSRKRCAPSWHNDYFL